MSALGHELKRSSVRITTATSLIADLCHRIWQRFQIALRMAAEPGSPRHHQEIVQPRSAKKAISAEVIAAIIAPTAKITP
jgi:hypothetical protein